MGRKHQAPVLLEWFEEYLDQEDTSRFVDRVADRYSVATLERLALAGQRMTRRAAVLGLTYIADYSSNAVMGRALLDRDRGVRTLADNGIRLLWCRVGDEAQRQVLESLVELNTSSQFDAAAELATDLLRQDPQIAEAWNQRAIAYYCAGRYAESIYDCRQALEINPYHFGAAAGMGQSHLRLGDQVLALESFQRALKLNPSLEGVRANVVHLQRVLKRKP